MKKPLAIFLSGCFLAFSLCRAEPELARNPDKAKWGFLKRPVLHLVGDLFYSQPFQGDLGVGASFRLEGQFFQWLSLGFYFDPAFYGRGGELFPAAPLGLMGRIIPIQEGPWNFFLIGGVSLNSFVSLNKGRWPGNFQGFAGVGGQTSVGGPWSLDLSVSYQLFSPGADPLQAVSARFGLDYALDL